MPISSSPDVDAVVVGAGFAGLRTIHSLRGLGLSMRVFEAGDDVGGTWYWNRYPGARTDTESWAYCFSFDQELWEQWPFKERFTAQGDVLEYLRAVADRHGMREVIQFSTRVVAAKFDAEANLWRVQTDDGVETSCRWLITGLGWLGIAYKPPFEGADQFEGESYVTSQWPHEPVDFAGKKVAVIGTGATGIQVIQTLAHIAGDLTVFQRTPNYVMPGRNHALPDEQLAGLHDRFEETWEQAYSHVFGFPMEPANRLGGGLSDQELEKIFEAGWEAGGFRFIFQTVDDMLVDQRVNDAASEFVRGKIRSIVKDPKTAEMLCPTTHPIGGKRPPLGNFYYEAFNRDNVHLISVREDPIEEITRTGIRTRSGSHDFDVIIYATGFDAITGPLAEMNVEGLDGRTIESEWASGGQMFLGLSAAGFPNMFSVLGPQAPFASHPPVIERQVEFIEKVISQALEIGSVRVETTQEAQQDWSDQCDAVLDATLLKQGMGDRPWFLGANVPGKEPSALCYLGGMGGFIAAVDAEVAAGFPGYRFSKEPARL
ncbi:flavin-containing monooxygenase [Gordonia polyisoprenivorans]|uniref:NAD(P)/FAD-dependent oxidoreductase n=2 Tax=Gordonia polyisoprenivorans TaxID=84595 RepID=A0A846WSE3_9ACTN|nr:NAD(P)/FAD-dependent oxidoreductase [Gordonia polyisoprenivorans]NKY04455.1 NAD(P)/FAD-dependent oxidoreductase [Gordonia polyisoprenivorans]OZC29489.1 NAD(P)/FAD-dependent oxidoreductase [Gordonia polyisoprenivorans]